MNDALPLLAHQGGWDEILIPLVLVVALFVWAARRRPTQDTAAGRRRPAICPYCRAALPPHGARCPSCGFRIERIERG